MAHQRSYISMTPDRSRSRDDPPMWGHPNPERPYDPTQKRSWNYTPALRRTRRVLIIIDLDPIIRNLMTERFSDVMQATTCEHLPNLSPSEEMALLFTYSFLLTPGQIQITSIENILLYISQHITNTWGTYLEPTSTDLRWSDCTGDTFALRPQQLIIRLLCEHRPNWTEAQEVGIFNRLADFNSPGQPYIMRLSCHKALPNPNMLTSFARYIYDTRISPTPFIWLLVIDTSHSNARCQSKLEPTRSISASIRDVSTSPCTSYTYIQRSHYVPIRHSSAKIGDHGG